MVKKVVRPVRVKKCTRINAHKHKLQPYNSSQVLFLLLYNEKKMDILTKKKSECLNYQIDVPTHVFIGHVHTQTRLETVLHSNDSISSMCWHICFRSLAFSALSKWFPACLHQSSSLSVVNCRHHQLCCRQSRLSAAPLSVAFVSLHLPYSRGTPSLWHLCVLFSFIFILYVYSSLHTTRDTIKCRTRCTQTKKNQVVVMASAMEKPNRKQKTRERQKLNGSSERNAKALQVLPRHFRFCTFSSSLVLPSPSFVSFSL